MVDLRVAAETVGENKRARRCLPDTRQQQPLSRLDRHLIAFSVLVAEGPGQAAAAGVEDLVVKPHPVEHLAVAVGVAGRSLMAVKVDHRLALQPRQLPVRSYECYQLAERQLP